MLPRWNAAFFLALVLFLGVAIADQRPLAVSDIPDPLPLLGATAVDPDEADERALRQSHAPGSAQLRSTTGETGKSFVVERHEHWPRPTHTYVVTDARQVAASPEIRTTVTFATGPPPSPA